LNDFLLDLHQFLAHQGLAKSLDISIGMPTLFANLAASRSWHISSQKIAQLRFKNLDNREEIYMPDVDEIKEAKKFHTDIPYKTEGFFLKGSNSLNWGMKHRLARIIHQKYGRTVMLPI